MSYADIRFQRIEENINELKESIKFLSDIMHDHLLDKNNKEEENKNNKEEENKNNKKVYEKEKKQKNDYPRSRLIEWVTSPSTILYGTLIGAFTSYGLYHFYDKK